MKYLPSEFKQMLLKFRTAFTAPSFETFAVLVCGWILCTTDHFITRLYRFGEGVLGYDKHHSAYYRFFKKSCWQLEQVSRILFELAAELVGQDQLLILVDDTLSHRSGPHIWGLGVFYDAVRSSYGQTEGVKRKNVYSTGHNWVIMSLWIPFPWNRKRGIAVPFLFRLYRAKKQTPEKQYKKRTELALEMESLVVSWMSEGLRPYFVGDYQYSGETFAGDLSERSHYVGPMVKDAALYEPDPEYDGVGRPPEKGERLSNPKEYADEGELSWKETDVEIYQEQIRLQYKSRVVLWWDVIGKEPVRMVVVRDPEGKFDLRAYYSTDPSLSVETIMIRMARRWKAEQMHRNMKQHMGMEDPRNGYVQRGDSKQTNTQDPQIREDSEDHQDRAAKRTIPVGGVVYAVVILWYLEHGSRKETVQRKKEQAPYWQHKQAPSFADMLEHLRMHIWEEKFLPDPVSDTGLGKTIKKLLPFLSAA